MLDPADLRHPGCTAPRLEDTHWPHRPGPSGRFRWPGPARRAGHRAAVALGLGVTAAVLTVVPGHAEVPHGWDQAFSDAYSRTSTGSWGSAYTLKGPAHQAGVSGGEAFEKLVTGDSLIATVNGVGAGDVDISDTVRVSARSGAAFDVFHGWVARGQDDDSGYHGRLRIHSDHRVSLGISRTNGASRTWLKGLALPTDLASGTALRGELQVTGTSPVTVRARAWAVGSTKPGWQIEYTDNSSARITRAGSVAVRNYVEDADTTITLSTDDLSVGTAGAATGPSAPPSHTTARGSVPVGTASYPVPAGAVFVSPHGSDSNAGTESFPLRTARAAALVVRAGGAIVLREGVYHESVTVPLGKGVTIQNYPREAVWFDGSSIVSGWTKEGRYWLHRGWTTEFSSMMGHDAAFKARFLGANPMAADPDQVFLDGTALKQVESPEAVTEGTFYVSDLGNTIVVGSDPTSHEVRASDLGKAIAVSGPNSVIQGIGVRRYANGYEKGGAIKMGNVGGIIRDVVIRDVATIGLSVTNSDKTIDHVTIRRAGQLGIAGYQNDNSVVTNSIVDDNNTELFKDAPVSGGMKFCASRTITIKNNEVNDNSGTGIWFDVAAYDMTIVDNATNGNTKYGIEVEVSDTGIVANNQAGGGEAGITVFDSGNLKVFNNEVGGSTQAGIKLIQDERRQSALGKFMEARDPRFLNVDDPTVPWLTQNIQVSNNIFGAGGWYQVFALDGKTGRAVDTWNLTVAGNLFNPRPAKTDPTMVAWGQGDNTTVERYETPAALADAKDPSWQNAQVPTSRTLTEMGGDKVRDASTAVPIPADVASATGLVAGAQLLGVH